MKSLALLRQFRRLSTHKHVVGDPNRTQGIERADKQSVKLRDEHNTDPDDYYPHECDALVVGGGAIGWSVAYWLTKFVGNKVVVLERDPSYTRASSTLSVGGIKQQFSEPENIQLSMFGAHFLNHIKENLSVFDLDPPDINFSPHGYLMLADDSKAEILQKNNEVQKQLGAKVELMSAEKISQTWPWINVSDIALGSYGTENEGWFDPYLLLQAFRRKALSQGVQFASGDLLDFEFSVLPVQVGDSVTDKKRLTAALVKTPDNLLRRITFGAVINAAGPWAAQVAHLAGIGGFAGEFSLPVEPRKQSAFVVSLPPSAAANQSSRLPGIDAPFVHDSNGLQLKREGFHGDFVTMLHAPSLAAADSDSVELSIDGGDLEVNYTCFDKQVLPKLVHRVPCMKAVKVRNAWAGFYDYNSYDQNLIIGKHNYHENFIFCNGSSGHGIQHAVGIGRAVAELVIYGRYKTIDLGRMHFNRIAAGDRVEEVGVC